jgi:hypothetical protein
MRGLGLSLLLLSAACSDGSTQATPATDAGHDAPLTTDPFCKGRPLLPFCEDFDEQALPGKFADIAGDASVLRIGDDATAPSPPKVLTISNPNAAAGVFLRTPFAARSAKANAFFRVRVEKIDAEVEIGAFAEQGGHRVAMVIAKDGSVGVRVVDAEAGGPVLRLSSVKVDIGAWESIRWDIRFVDGSARTRLRVGDATAFDAEPIGLIASDAVERLEVGASGAVTLSFDSVTFEPNAE